MGTSALQLLQTMIGMRVLYGDAGVAIATGLLTFVMLVFLKFSLKRLRRCTQRKWDYFQVTFCRYC